MEKTAQQENTDNLKPSNFIRDIIDRDLESSKHSGVVTRFPPEPNGYLHIGHAKSICLNFGIAQDYRGRCHLRFDDTNPSKEETEYIDSIQEDVKWLGFEWGEHLYYASGYFDKLYEFACQLIKLGKAYVCELTTEQMREYRGSLTEPGVPSPYRNRSPEENLTIFEQMKDGKFPDNSRTLRAKIDMASGNVNMRDPVLYRIMRSQHHRTGDTWCIYPMYDFTHCLSDMLEGVTHSLCTLEFEDHRPLYDWVLDELSTPRHPQQIEFARLNLTCTVMSKRKLLQLVTENHVSGWDDPRMPTIAGLRRRGYTPTSIRNFCSTIGVAKTNSVIDLALLEHHLREDLNKTSDRVMVVLNPLKLTITNYPEGRMEELDAENNPEEMEKRGTRKIPFSRNLYIERDDFMENPPGKYFRLSPGKEIRLKHAYYITCDEVIKDPDTGEVTELLCRYDMNSRGGWTEDGRKVRGTSHWVSADHAVNIEVRLYDNLFKEPVPGEGKKSFLDDLNLDSLRVLSNCKAEPSLEGSEAGKRFQFLRQGYFCVDKESSKKKPIFNKTIGLKDSWAKKQR